MADNQGLYLDRDSGQNEERGISMYRVIIAENVVDYLNCGLCGVEFDVKSEYDVKEYVADFAKKGLEVLVIYDPDGEEGE